MDTNDTLQTNCDLQEASNTSPAKDPTKKTPKNGESSTSDDSDIENDLVTNIQHSDFKEEEDRNSFFYRYFSNHSNSLPARLAVNYARRLSQCREEDEDEEKKDVVPSNMSTISGSDKSLSESSSGSKTSVIDTISGPTHKFVITKTKTSEIKEEPKPTAEETKKELSEAAKLFAGRKEYRQANTVLGVPGYDPKRPPVSSIFQSPLQSPHYDSNFFDSSLIEIKSQSTSTVDNCTNEDIWVKRRDLEANMVSTLTFI